MKLIHEEWRRQIPIEENRIPVLCLENPQYFSETVREMLRQKKTGRGKFIFSDDKGSFDLSKTVEVLLSPFDLNFDAKKIQTAIIKRLAAIAMDEAFCETQELMQNLQQFVYSLTDSLEYEVTVDPEIDLASLIKLTNVRIESDTESLESALLDYFMILKEVFHVKLFVCVNFRTFFSQKSLETLYDSVILKKINLLMLENTARSAKISCEDWLIIDEDLCEI